MVLFTDVFDFACHHGKKHTKDLGLILEQMCHHYCGTLTFQEQWNTVENMRQKSHESAADFLVRVSGAVDGLARDWKGVVSQHEIKALLSEEFINGVQVIKESKITQLAVPWAMSHFSYLILGLQAQVG